MGNQASRDTKTKSTPNGETIGGIARGKTVEEKISVVQEEIANEQGVVVFPSDEEEASLTEEEDTDSEYDEEDEEEGK